MQHLSDRLFQKRWGIFTHYLYVPDRSLSLEKNSIIWNNRVDNFNVSKLGEQLHEIGAGYYFITVMQGNEFILSPNSAYDKIAGVHAGELCSHRDLIADIADELSKYDIDLYLYYTGDGPYKNEEIGKKFGFAEPRKNVSKEFVKNWASVLEEYSIRYGDKVKGYWIDGCYDYFGYSDELLDIYYKAIKKGNKNAITAFNNGFSADGSLSKWYKNEEFVCGECLDFSKIPENAFIDGARAHILSPLGLPDGEYNPGWLQKGLKHDHKFMKEFIHKVNAVGGVVTIDIYINEDGTLEQDQINVLKGI